MKNTVSLIGNIGGDLELKNLEFGEVLNFQICVDESYLNQSGEKVQKAEWFNLFAAGNIAQQLKKNFKKGDQIAIVGKLRNRRFMNKTTQKEEYIVEILVKEIEYKACISR